MAQFRKTTGVAAHDRLTAVLALAADRPGPSSPCPPPPDLAAFIEGKLSGEARQSIKTHLADCEECYALWCAVTAGLEEEGHGRRQTSSLLKPRNLTYLGSALALAASVALFINIYDPGLPGSDSITPAGGEGQRESSQVQSEQGEAEDGQMVAGQTKPMEKNTAPAAATEPIASQAEQIKRKDGAHSPPAAAPPAAVAPMTETASAAAVRQTARATTPLEQWLQQVETECRQDKAGLEFWWRIEEDGQAIKSSLALAAEDSPDRQQLFARLLTEVQEIRQAKDIAGQCKRIKAALAAAKARGK